MTQMFFDDLEDRRGEVERHRENSARIAEAFARYRSVGLGSIEFAERVDFGLTFIEEPFMAYGCQLDAEALIDEIPEDFQEGSMTPEFPLCTGFVTDWDRDDRGFYMGAWVGVRVWFPYESNIPPESQIEIFHHFSFKAVAMKDVDPAMMNESS